MDFPPDTLKALMTTIANTADAELTCEESGERVHRYIEFRVGGTGEMPADLRAVQQHLSVCGDCMEVVEAIVETVRAEQGR